MPARSTVLKRLDARCLMRASLSGQLPQLALLALLLLLLQLQVALATATPPRAAKILATHWACGTSHALAISKIARDWAERGYHVVYLTGDHDLLRNNYTGLDVRILHTGLSEQHCIDVFSVGNAATTVDGIVGFSGRAVDACLDLLHFAEKELRGEHFDVLLEDATYGWCSRALVPLLNIALPPIHVSTIGLTQPWIAESLGDLDNSLASLPQMGVPHLLDLMDHSLLARFSNAVTSFRISAVFHSHFVYPIEQFLRQRGLPSWYDLPIGVACLPLSFGLIPPRLVPSNWFVIGPLLAGPPTAIPDQLARHIERATEGVVLVTVGTLFGFPSQLEDEVLEGLSRLPSGWVVIWKTPSHQGHAQRLTHKITRSNSSDRFLLSDWIPQRAVLHHPKLRVVLHHGGFNTFVETAYAGKPALILPLAADQENNAMLAVQAGIAVALNKFTLTADDVVRAFHATLRLTEAPDLARVATLLQRTDALGSLATLLDEHLATNGSQHLVDYRSMKRSWVHQHSLDLLVLSLGAVAIVVALLAAVLHLLLRACCMPSLRRLHVLLPLQVVVFAIIFQHLCSCRNVGDLVRLYGPFSY